MGKPNAPDVRPSRQFISIWKHGQAAIAGLKIREWACDCCGVIHDRDINASKNILRIGQDALAVGASQLSPAITEQARSVIIIERLRFLAGM